MNLTISKITWFCGLMLLFINTAHANLLLAPTYVTFDERQRSAKLTLINSGDKTRSYRISWVEKQAFSSGNYNILTAVEAQDHQIASPMLRLSPKQVTLKPNQKQTIKIALRKPRNLPAGDYRSHLLLTALPEKSDTSKQKTTGVYLNLLLSYSIPVIVRQGQLDSTLSIDNVQLTHDASKKKTKLAIDIGRAGLHSSRGNVMAYWQPLGGGKESIAAQVRGLTIAHELDKRTVNINWPDSVPASGRLKVQFVGSKEHAHKILAERIFDISPSMFKPMIN